MIPDLRGGHLNPIPIGKRWRPSRTISGRKMMPGLNGFEAAACIHEQLSDAEILIVTEHDSRTLEYLPLQPGVRGYVSVAGSRSRQQHQPVSLFATP